MKTVWIIVHGTSYSMIRGVFSSYGEAIKQIEILKERDQQPGYLYFIQVWTIQTEAA